LTHGEIISDYQSLNEEKIRAALMYAATHLSNEEAA
jgi:uncharacterized protein (DUF433 family)